MRSPLPLIALVVALDPSRPAQKHTNLASTAQPQQPPFVGEWRQERAQYPFALRISGRSGNWSIHGWGYCKPQACDWGESRLTMLGTNVNSADFQRAFATWDHGFATRHVIVRMEGSALIAEFYVLFTESGRSGRSDYFQIERFTKARVPGQG